MNKVMCRWPLLFSLFLVMYYENMSNVLKAQDKQSGDKMERMFRETEINRKTYRHTASLKVKWYCSKRVAED